MQESMQEPMYEAVHVPIRQQYLGQILPDMDVCDIDGDRIGSVARVYRHDVGHFSGTTSAGQPPPEEIVEVKTGFLGLGKHLYVPMSAIQEVTLGCVFLSESRANLEGTNWFDKPRYVDELH